MNTDFTPDPVPTAVLVLASGEAFYGIGIGAEGRAVGEVCFNTAMTGYQEILTDPSYAAQIVTFTFPHIGNTGTTEEDEEATTDAARIAARGAIFRASVTPASSWRSETELGDWLSARGIIGLSGIDTRALTAHIRDHGMPNGVIAHAPDGQFDIVALAEQARSWNGLVGADLARDMAADGPFDWRQARWQWPDGHRDADGTRKVVLIDYGVKRNILRNLISAGLAVTVVPGTTSAKAILALNPDGVVLSNGPGDPAATGDYAIPVIRDLIAADMPILGICLGHQMLALALGAKTVKMEQGHHGANHPVMDHTTDKVEIVSMNHGFAVDQASLPDTVEETHVSLFDGSNCGIRLKGKPVFSVQHHPEASPGPQDSVYLFDRFADAVKAA
ncbi:glutamine-hydrolyzing carbamoyl-phosphate synthase small subunit [Algimonas porphyrae]|uniref:Carbamoyl phosphate synthase small chain n=1 Tax=Algimonas porphyrae TaxID=1128113 RepID=A0ABQ5V2V5_9PROT|nr:glutamine-hydrolyzing carbamoyl-phosphate synthase small subunit [Algimonas porphyrae]GLQ21866.1 carbamoyl-phosphate synthase small chain [Algimonas porphyrae]